MVMVIVSPELTQTTVFECGVVQCISSACIDSSQTSATVLTTVIVISNDHAGLLLNDDDIEIFHLQQGLSFGHPAFSRVGLVNI